MPEESHQYREVPPDETFHDFDVAENAVERFRMTIQAQLIERLRQAGVCTIFPVSGAGELLLEEASLRKALNVTDDEAFDDCLSRTTERVELKSGTLRHTFWTEADVMRSGLLWEGNSAIQTAIADTLLKRLMPVALSQVLMHRKLQDDAVHGEFSELENVELYALIEQMVNAIVPGVEGMLIGGDEPEQGDLFEEEGTI